MHATMGGGKVVNTLRSKVAEALLSRSRIFSTSSSGLGAGLAPRTPSKLGLTELVLSGPSILHHSWSPAPLWTNLPASSHGHGASSVSSHSLQTPFAVRGLSTAAGASKEVVESDVNSVAAGKEVEAMVEEKKQKLVQEGVEVEQSEYWGIVPKKHKREDGTDWPWHAFRPSDCYAADVSIDLKKHFKPRTWGDTFAYYLVKAMRIPTDIFFQRRFGCRAMMLETVAGVPGMVGGMLLHLQSLRRFQHTGGWIRALLDEAENERMHLMTFMEVSKPKWYERALVLAVQGVFFNIYFLVYLISPRTAHRVVGYLEEEAVHSYTEFLRELDAGKIENVAAPQIAIDYWRLPKDATLRDVVLVVRADEAHHRDVNHFASNVLKSGKKLHENPAPVDYH